MTHAKVSKDKIKEACKKILADEYYYRYYRARQFQAKAVLTLTELTSDKYLFLSVEDAQTLFVPI